MWSAIIFIMGTALGDRCKLEEDRFCDFTKYHCHFNYSDMRDADHHSSFMELLSKPLKATEDNKGCNLPDDTKEMTISIEPCFTDFSTSVDPGAKYCPDPGPEYYQNNGRTVTTMIDVDEKNTVPADLTNGAYVSGDPIEFHIISIGRHYIFGEMPEKNGPYTGATNVTNGLSIKDFIFRTFPLNAHDFNVLNKNMGEQTRPDGDQCPIEIQFADDRTVHMNLKQQYENIYVLFSRYYADLGGNAIRQGRGCYMCHKMNGDNNTDAVEKNKDDWLKQYHPDCHLYAKEYAGSYAVNTDQKQNVFQQMTDITFRRDVVAGVYTLYPYVKIPENIKNQVTMRTLIEKQLRYILDPQYHVTVEVVGMKKGFGSRIFRNTHGRMLEKNLVKFEPQKKTLYGNQKHATDGKNFFWEDIDEEKKNPGSWGTFDFKSNKRHEYTPTPNKCLISFAKYSERQEKQEKVMICSSDLDNMETDMHPYDPLRIHIYPSLNDSIKNFHMEDDEGTKKLVTESLKAAFDDDYCFHRPGTIRFKWHRVTFCQTNVWYNIRDFIEDRWGGSDEAKNLAHLKMFEETDSFELTICEYENLLDEIEYLNTVDLNNIHNQIYGTDRTFFCLYYEAKIWVYDIEFESLFEAFKYVMDSNGNSPICNTFSQVQEESKKFAVAPSFNGLYIEFLPFFLFSYLSLTENRDYNRLPILQKIVKKHIMGEKLWQENKGYLKYANP